MYSAFVSYSHAADEKLAPAIQRALHAFAKPWYKLRALRVFRDKTSLSANPALWSAIEQALSQSEWFLYMASPQAAQSRWVGQEIAWWIQHRKCEKMLILLTDGDLVWDDTTNDFDWIRTSAVPNRLKNQFPGEPLYVDLRWAKTEENLSLRHSQFRAAILDIAAPVHGRAKDELDGEDVRQYRKTRRWAWTAGIVLAVLAVAATVAAVIAVQQRDQAEVRRQIAFSRQVAAQALNQLGGGRLDSALLLALESRNILTSVSAETDPHTFDARSSLLTALEYGSPPITSYLHGGNLVAFSPDGKTLASASANEIIVWDVATRKPVGRSLASHGDAVFSIAFSPDGKILASSSRSEKNLIFWNLDTRTPVRPPITAHGGTALTLAFSPDGRTLATGGGDKTVVFWDLETRQPIGQPLSGHTSNVVSLAFSRDGKMLASGSWDGTVILWNVNTQSRLELPLDAHASLGQSFGQVESVAFSPDGRYLASGGGGGTILWDVSTGKAIGTSLSHPGGVKSVAFSPDGKILASGSGGTVGTVILWNVEKREPLRQPLRGHTKWIDSVVFSPDGKTLVSSGGDDVILLWDLASLHRLAAVFPGYEGPTDSVAISRGGTIVASGICIETDDATSRHSTQCRQGGIRLWSRASGKELRTLRTGYPGTPTSLVFRNDAETLLSTTCAQADGGGSCRGIEVQMWDIGTGRFEQYSINEERPKLDSMALSPDGKIVAAGSCKSVGGGNTDCAAGEIRLFNIQTGRQIGASLIGHSRGVHDLTFSPDGQTLASSTLDDVILWNVSTGRPRGRPQPGSKIAFAFDGKISAVSAPPVSGPPRTITLRDTSTNQPIGQLAIGDHDVVRQMAFSRDGKILAVSNVVLSTNTSSITLWDVVRGERLGQPLEWRGGRAFAVGFSPDGKTLVAGSEDHGLISWDVNLESWRERACGIANRNLTYEEWTQFLGEEPYRATCPTLPIDPNILEAGRRGARAGDIEGAIAIFKRALELNPALKLDPKKEAIKSSVEEIVANGRYLAESGDIEGATASFERAKKLDRDLPLDPLAEARKLAAPGLLAVAEQLAQQGKITESITAFASAQKFDPALKVSGTAWNTLCWIGSLQGRVAEVMGACEKAVRADPEAGRFRTSRGLAKAMVQKVDESISDFEAFLAWEKDERQTRMGWSRRQWLQGQKLRHEGWIAALRAGQNPFTPEELRRLLEEESSK